MKNVVRAAYLLSFLSGYATPAFASAGPTFGGPIGATDINNAYLPPPGLFGGLAEGYATASEYSLNNGAQVPASATVNVVAVYLGYVYPFKVLGGSLASGIQPSYFSPYHVQLDKNEPEQHLDGWGDTYVDFLNWSRYVGPLFGETLPAPSPNGPPEPYGLTIKAEYSMIFPTSVYDPNRPFNSTGHTYFFIPNIAATYLTTPDALGGGVEFDAHLFYDHQSENWQVDYSSGNIMDLDFAVAQRLGRWTVGGVGTWAIQLESDKVGPQQTPVPPSGQFFETLRLGPIVKYDIPSWRAFIKLKSDLSVVTRNSLSVTDVFAVFGFLF